MLELEPWALLRDEFEPGLPGLGLGHDKCGACELGSVSLLRGLACRLGLLSFAALVAWAASAQAQPTKDELAQEHFESGAAYLQQSDYDNALRELESA